MKVAYKLATAVFVGLLFAITVVGVAAYIERQLEFGRIRNAKPTYSKLENGSYYDLNDKGEWVKQKPQ
jgi:hypothetical protein